MLLFSILAMPLPPPQNYLQKLSTVAHNMTLYRASTGPDFLFAYSMPVLHLTYKTLDVSPARPFLLMNTIVRQ